MGTDLIQARLRWRCRRGMKELDQLLLNYLQGRFAQADAAERETFAACLELPDPQLASWLLGRSTPEEPQFQQLMAHIRAATPAA
ncbi:MAG TPA: succinate dehydrogenase assembly factor 2 [Steroidobacteraceae bacterium]|nr:succinate dehydrogenase assembly factor 2 [Steroidobacteraceae bacterium]